MMERQTLQGRNEIHRLKMCTCQHRKHKAGTQNSYKPRYIFLVGKCLYLTFRSNLNDRSIALMIITEISGVLGIATLCTHLIARISNLLEVLEG